MRRLRALATVTLVATLVLSACSDDEEPQGAESPTPSTSPSTPTSSAPTEEPTKPALPKAAKKATEAGARAFMQYYFEVLNYVQNTGRVRQLSAVSSPDCDSCNGVIDLVRQTYKGGGYVTDGNYTVAIESTEQVDVESSEVYAFEAQVSVHNDEHKAVNAEGDEKVYPASERDYTFYVLWVDDHWRLDVWKVD